MKFKISTLLAILLLFWWGFNRQATGGDVVSYSPSDRFPSPILLAQGGDTEEEEEEQSRSTIQCDGEDCYRDPPPDRTIPNIISPGGAIFVLNSQPVVRWYPVEGAEEYAVRLEGISDSINWETSVMGDRWWVPYKGEPLQPGAEYLLIVRAGDRTAKETFSIVREERANQIKAEISQLRQRIPQGEELELAVAKLLSDEGLILDAIATLEKLVAMDTRNPEVYCTLGGLYETLDHSPLAERLEKKAKEAGGSCSL